MNIGPAGCDLQLPTPILGVCKCACVCKCFSSIGSNTAARKQEPRGAYADAAADEELGTHAAKPLSI